MFFLSILFLIEHVFAKRDWYKRLNNSVLLKRCFPYVMAALFLPLMGYVFYLLGLEGSVCFWCLTRLCLDVPDTITKRNPSEWWWPNGINYWPPWATRDNRMESLEEVFAGLGYEQCYDVSPEDGCQKVALYEIQSRFQHAAAQMPNGRWRSKMGRGPVIEHRNPDSLSSGIYGNSTVFMRRNVSATS